MMIKRSSSWLKFHCNLWEIDIFVEMKGNCKWGISCNLSWKWNAIFTASSAIVFKLPNWNIWLSRSHGYQPAWYCVGTNRRNWSPRRSTPELAASKGFPEVSCMLARKGQHWIAVRSRAPSHTALLICQPPWECSLLSGKLHFGHLNSQNEITPFH